MNEFAQISGGLFTALALMSVPFIAMLFLSAFTVFGSVKIVGGEINIAKSLLASASSFFLSAIGHYAFIHFFGKSMSPLALFGSIIVIAFVVLALMIFAMDEVDVGKSFAAAGFAMVFNIIVVTMAVKLTPSKVPFELYREFKREVRGTELKVRKANYLARKKAAEEEKAAAEVKENESYEFEPEEKRKTGRELLD